tara:strand:+ start:352 stop:717 length:366 start_codon:yes stop_codon:yes gene_type:complete
VLAINFPYAAISVQVSTVVVLMIPQIAGLPIAVFDDTPVTTTSITGITDAAPTKAVDETPAAPIVTPAPCVTVVEPTAEVEAIPLGDTTARPSIVGVPIADAEDNPDGSTTVMAVPHEPDP